jgi:outer membrane protein assembly factor BamD
MRHLAYIFISVLVLSSSCGEYEKLLKSTDYDLKKQKSKEYFEAGQYVKTTELLAQILQRFRATDEAEELNWMNSQSYYGMKDYASAGVLFKSFTEQYPYGKYAEEATYLTALCDYYISPRAELDQESTKAAIEGFSVFMNRYPYSTKVPEAVKLSKELEESLVEISFLSAKVYYDMEQYKAAITALSNSLKEYTDSKYREDMMYMKLSSLFLYAELSFADKQKERYQATLDDYYSYMEEFPESKYGREVRKIYEDTSRFLKIDNLTESEITQ